MSAKHSEMHIATWVLEEDGGEKRGTVGAACYLLLTFVSTFNILKLLSYRPGVTSR